jgi:hypothetical protein
MKNLSMNELEKLGFTVIKTYRHDNFITSRRQKGNLLVETTWDTLKNYQQVSQDVTIEETFIDEFTIKDLRQLDRIINVKKQ